MSPSSYFSNARVAVTGGAGTVGSEIVRQLLASGVSEVRVLDNHEGDLFALEHEIGDDPRVHLFFADIRNAEKLERMFGGMDYAFHTAALKHVPLCEKSPFEATQTNIVGVENVIRAAARSDIKKVIFTSSDKAVNPTNVMGTSKLMGERLITAANALNGRGSGTIFSSTRFGNVGGSKGSVIPLFCKQIAKGGPITITSPDMTRFMMTLSASVDLVVESMMDARGGEVFVTKMPVIRVGDLLDVMLEMIAPQFGRKPDQIEVRNIGSRPGEKFWEELTTPEEMRRTYELNDFFVVLPAFRNVYNNIDYDYLEESAKPMDRVYVSSEEPLMSKDEIRSFLLEKDVLPDEVRNLLLSQVDENAAISAPVLARSVATS